MKAISNQVLAISAAIGIVLGISYLPVASTFSFQLSRLLYEDDTESQYYERPVFPRRDLKEEFGEVKYECLIESALSVDGGICLNGDLGKISDTNKAPSASPVLVDQFSKRSKGYEYGVDVTFPIHNYFAQDGQYNEAYTEFIKGCKKLYHSDPSACTESEVNRIDMNKNQPPVMQNYTTIGFQKTKAPKDLMRLLKNFFRENISDIMEDPQSFEKWHPGDTHTNHWKSSTKMIRVDNPNHKGGGMPLKNKIWDAAHNMLQTWIQAESPAKINLQPASLYGIRVYGEGAVLAPHVDRLPLVTSAIINVAQDLDGGEPWPLEVYGHDGVAYNVTLEPGDMLLYESHSVIHGRPFPFQGKYYANVFIHFEPENHCLRHAERMQGNHLQQDAEEMFRRAQRKQKTLASDSRNKQLQNVRDPHENAYVFSATELPFFIQPETTLSKRWKQEVKYDRNLFELREAPPPNLANNLASRGELAALKQLAEEDPEVLFQSDANGWKPLHEAARSGNVKIVKYLIEQGVDLNARTNAGRGANALWWVEEHHGVDHEAAEILRRAGAIRLAPNV